MFFVRAFAVLVLVASVGARFKNRLFFPWEFPGPKYIIGEDGCPTNALCLFGSDSCQKDSECPKAGTWKCCSDFISRACCMNLTGASTPVKPTRTTTLESITTTTTEKDANGGGGGGDEVKDVIDETENEAIKEEEAAENGEKEEIKLPGEETAPEENPPPGENENENV